MSNEDSRFDEVIANYLRAEEAGTPPDQEMLIAEHPELADKLRSFFADHTRSENSVMDDKTLPPKSSSNSALVYPTETEEYLKSSATAVAENAKSITNSVERNITFSLNCPKKNAKHKCIISHLWRQANDVHILDNDPVHSIAGHQHTVALFVQKLSTGS